MRCLSLDFHCLFTAFRSSPEARAALLIYQHLNSLVNYTAAFEAAKAQVTKVMNLAVRSDQMQSAVRRETLHHITAFLCGVAV